MPNRMKWLFIAIAFVTIIGCGTTEEKLTDENANFRFDNWEGIINRRAIDPADFYYPVGNVKQMKVFWRRNQRSLDEEFLYLVRIFSERRLPVQNIWTPDNADSHIDQFFYTEDVGRIQVSVNFFL
jgi:hypothetical protein